MPLPGDDSRLLERLAAAPSTTQALALRARMVLLSEQHSVAEAARMLDVSRHTVAKWRTRFVEAGPDGLRDQARPGRPVSIDDDVQRQVLGVQLRPPPGGAWTTRAVAAELGISQTAVSKVRRTWFADHPDIITRSVLNASNRVTLAAVFASESARALLFHEPLSPAVSGYGSASEGPARIVRESVRTVLSARFGCESGVSPDGPGPSPGRPQSEADLLDVVGRVNKVVPPDRRVITIVDAELPTEVQRWLYRHPRFSVYEVAPGNWLAQLSSITDAIDRRQSTQLLDLEGELRQWASKGRRSFGWVRSPRVDDVDTTGAGVPTSGGVARTSAPRLVTAVVKELRESIATGAFRAGQKIPEEPLAARLGVSRGPIRDALQILAEDGLVALEPHRGAYIPIPTRQDIFDTYTARGPLGALLLRRVATRGRARLGPVEAALAEVVRISRTGDAPAAGDADIRWQDAVAHAADMPRIEKIFVRLSLQLRMFISILGLDYAYAVDEIVSDDTEILKALRNQDPDLVTTLWSRKIDNSVLNMVELFRRHGGAENSLPQ